MLAGLVLTDALILTDKSAVPTQVDTLWHKVADWKLARFHAWKKQIRGKQNRQRGTSFSATFSNVSVWTEQVQSQTANRQLLKGLSLFCLNRRFPALWNQIANPLGAELDASVYVLPRLPIVCQTAAYCVSQAPICKICPAGLKETCWANVWNTWRDK